MSYWFSRLPGLDADARVLRLFLSGMIFSWAPALAADSPAAPAGLQTNVTFSEYSPLSRAPELARRMLSPLLALQMKEVIAKSGRELREQSIDLAQEKFVVYIPPAMPQGGYALLVFVMPWRNATLPSAWTAALDTHGMIFVTPVNSGNDTSVLDRRDPLGLLAAYNIMQRYHVDPARVFVGGLSGGSRVALRLALAYPDLFRGALLNAGSDPIGTAKLRLPPAELMHQFQESSRLVYLTGQEDVGNIDRDVRSRESMRGLCVFDIDTVTVPWTGHEIVSSIAFKRGLDALETHTRPTADKLTSCRHRYEQELDEKLHQVETLQASGKADSALALLDTIDQHFGGLAAPRSVALAQRLHH